MLGGDDTERLPDCQSGALTPGRRQCYASGTMKAEIRFLMFVFAAAGVAAPRTALADEAAAGKLPEGVLTEKQIAELVQAHTDETSGRRYKFEADFQTRKLHPVRDWLRIRKYKESGEVPFIVTANFYEIKEHRGRTLERRITRATAHVYVRDDQGQIVDRQDVALITLCPG